MLALVDWDWSVSGWTIVIAVLAGVACASVGVFLVLRQMSMMGDAISHAVLPGLVAAFVVAGGWSGWGMFVGAAVAGLATAVFVQWVHRFGDVDRGAAMGVVFTTLFAVGLIALQRTHDRVDLDPSCVLYGNVDLAVLDTVRIGWLGDARVPRAVLPLGAVLLLNLSVIGLLYKELRITSFDPQLATTLGFRSGLMHYLLMVLVAVTTVASFEAIGSILVIAMLIVPAAAAHLLTDRLGAMLVVAMGLAALSAVAGHWVAVTVPGWFVVQGVRVESMSSAGSMAVVAGLLLVLAILFGPRHGLLPRAASRARLASRVAREDVLGLLYRLEELEAGGSIGATVMRRGDFTRALASPGWVTRWALRVLVRRGRVTRDARGVRLTDDGRSRAQRVVRAHRLWETYLAERLRIPLDHVHAPAERLEHVTTDEMAARLAAVTGDPATDPHGTRVPGGEG